MDISVGHVPHRITYTFKAKITTFIGADFSFFILESKSALLVAAVLVDFPENKCNFLHKTSLLLDGVIPSVSLTASGSDTYVSIQL